MSDVKRLVNSLKRMNNNLNERNMNDKIIFGEVIETNPLKVKADNRFIIDEDFLILTTNVKEKKLNLQHLHSYSGGSTGTALDDEITVIPALSISEKVMLLRIKGGQEFIILDRL